jgi:hypothetical protein
LHYVSYTILIAIIIFSVVNVTHAALYSTSTPNPGHPWSELGFGAFQFTNDQTAFRTYTLPDADATVLTDNAAVTVPQGGTGVNSLTGVVVGNGASSLSAVALSAGQSIRMNALGTAYEAFTPDSGSISSIAVASTNGFAGSMSGGTTPTLTLSTTITGLLKGNGTAISAAIPGTDYQIPITLTTSGTSGAVTFNPSTGALNIPRYDNNTTGSFNSFQLLGSISGFIGFAAPANAGSTTYIFPSSDGTSGQVLATNGNGILSWMTSSPTYTNLTPTPITVGGISSGSTFNNQTVQNIINQLLYPYIGPSISLSINPDTGPVREFGNNVTAPVLNATTTKHTNNITSVSFYRNGSLIHTQSSPNPNGGTESYTDTTPVAGNGVIYNAVVGDGTNTTTSNSLSYTFVYPFYYGVGAPGLTGAQIRSTLTLLVKTPSNTVTVTSPVNQVFYLAYPDTSPTLSSILDTNGFETISDYTLRAVSIVGLDGTSQTYKVYEYNNPTTQTSFTNTYKF